MKIKILSRVFRCSKQVILFLLLDDKPLCLSSVFAMPEGEPQPHSEVKAEDNEKVEQEIVDGTVAEADVLEEDDDFEDFQHEGQLSEFSTFSIFFFFIHNELT